MEARRSAADVGRELGVSKHTVYAWKAKHEGMSVGEAQRLRQLEDENQRIEAVAAMKRCACDCWKPRGQNRAGATGDCKLCWIRTESM